jgi:hypothetical protein
MIFAAIAKRISAMANFAVPAPNQQRSTSGESLSKGRLLIK